MSEEKKAKSTTIYDFANPSHKLNAEWPLLDTVNEQLAGNFGSLLARKLQIALECQRLNTKSCRYSDCVASMGPSCVVFELSLEPLEGVVWFCMDVSVISTLVDAYFGGDAILTPVEEMRALSKTEQRVVNHVVEVLMNGLSTAWAPIMPVNVTSIGKTDSRRLLGSTSDGIMVMGEFQILIDSTQLPFQIIYPAEALKPYESRLKQEPAASVAPEELQFNSEMQSQLMHCEIDIRGVLSEMPITLGNLLELKSGDFIPLRDVQTVSFKTHNIPLFDATVGNSNGRVSASVSRWHLPVNN